MVNPLVENVSILILLFHIVEDEIAPLEEGQSVGYLTSSKVPGQQPIPILDFDRAQLADDLIMLLLLVFSDVRERDFCDLVIPDDLKIVHLGSIHLHDVSHPILNLVHNFAETACEGPEVEPNRRFFDHR